MYYVKESGFYYERKHGPYATLQEAMANKPADEIIDQGRSVVRYTIESEQGGTQTFLTE